MFPKPRVLAAGWTPGPLLSLVLPLLAYAPKFTMLLIVGIMLFQLGVALYVHHPLDDAKDGLAIADPPVTNEPSSRRRPRPGPIGA